MKVKIKPEVFVEAAELVANGDAFYSCLALQKAARKAHKVGDYTDRGFAVERAYCQVYTNYFGRAFNKRGFALRKHPFWDKRGTGQKQRENLKGQRVLALLTTAEILKNA